MYEEGGLRQGRGATALPPLHYIQGQGERGGALGFPLGGGGQADWISLGKILGRLAPQAKQVEDCLPSKVEVPHLPK